MFGMKKFLAVLVVFIVFACFSVVYGFPSGRKYPPEFTLRYGEWYDSWGFNRNYYGGADGFLPNVAYESVGSERELAYSLGEWFRSNYPDKVERAEAILSYVQSWTDYGYDEDTVVMEGEPQVEWAWNADEMAHMFDETTLAVAVGDCEDLAFLCSTIYLAAGFDVVLVSPPEHVALMIWLPEFDNAKYYWDISGDGREYGWIWVEATAEENPLGWTPPDFDDGDFEVFSLGFSEFNVMMLPSYPEAEDDVTVRASIISARGIVTEVLLNYTIGNVQQVIPMVAEGSFFEAVVPRQAEGTRVVCVVSAVDSEGFFRERTFEYVVGQDFQLPPYVFEVAAVLLVIVVIVILLSR
jgi:hypothetical protein